MFRMFRLPRDAQLIRECSEQSVLESLLISFWRRRGMWVRDGGGVDEFLRTLAEAGLSNLVQSLQDYHLPHCEADPGGASHAPLTTRNTLLQWVQEDLAAPLLSGDTADVIERIQAWIRVVCSLGATVTIVDRYFLLDRRPDVLQDAAAFVQALAGFGARRINILVFLKDSRPRCGQEEHFPSIEEAGYALRNYISSGQDVIELVAVGGTAWDAIHDRFLAFDRLVENTRQLWCLQVGRGIRALAPVLERKPPKAPTAVAAVDPGSFENHIEPCWRDAPRVLLSGAGPAPSATLP